MDEYESFTSNYIRIILDSWKHERFDDYNWTGINVYWMCGLLVM